MYNMLGELPKGFNYGRISKNRLPVIYLDSTGATESESSEAQYDDNRK